MHATPFTEFPSSRPAIHVPNWALILLFIAYALPGNLGHTLWRGDDALHIGVAYSMFKDGNWLVPQIAGVPYLDWPPLFYWLGLTTASLFGWLLPLPDAIRLGGVLALTALLIALRYAAREIYGRESASAAAMLALGSLGLLIHAHEMQPQVLLAACLAITLYGLVRMRTTPVSGALITGAGSGAAFLAAGLPGLFLCLPLWFVLPATEAPCRTRNFLFTYIHALWPLVILTLAWPLALSIWQPDYLSAWWTHEILSITPHTGHIQRSNEIANLIGWFTWPLWPVVLWSLWHRRQRLIEFGHALPLVAAVLSLMLITSTGTIRPANVVPLLPALIILASGELCRLDRGAANAFDWFGLIIFSMVGVGLWLAWSALNFGWPVPLSRNVLRLLPGFHPNWNAYELMIAVLLSLAWIIAIFRLPFFPLRGAVHWALGVTLTWGLATTLWLTWFDYDKNYAPAFHAVATQIKQNEGNCVAGLEVGDSQRAAFYYFTGIKLDISDTARDRCSMLLAYSNGRHALPKTGSGWKRIWQTIRGRGRLEERFGLFVKTS
jgi:4-amino-4-deoxy-L-arabinose transferase-like glycosyltransferase